jgi:hypothetical protein
VAHRSLPSFSILLFYSPKFSLADLSLQSGDLMAEDPVYNMFRHAFLVLGNANEGDTVGLFDGSPIEQYGDTIVNDLFKLDIIGDIEIEAALVMNVWMMTIHELSQVAKSCSDGEQNDAMIALDRAAAFWIGEGQVVGSNDDGHLLYNLFETAGERFGQDNGEGETKVNTDLLGLFVQIQTDVFSGNCAEDSGYIGVRNQVKRATALMTVGLVQSLIHHIMNVDNDGGSDFVELYSLALIPRVAACDPDAYQNELNLNVLRELPVEKQSASIGGLEQAYSCFQITCADVGSYMSGVVKQCVDPTDVNMAGYITSRQDALSKSYLDRDILQIDIFMRFSAYDAAGDWYYYGYNSIYSLQDLALNEVVPLTTGSLYGVFQDYYQDDTFADTMFTNILDSESKDQIRYFATGLLKHVIMYISTVSALQFAVEECINGNKASALDFWDTGVAFYIGSMEGELPTGSFQGGQLMFNTANKFCAEFGTCSGPVAQSSEIILAALKDGMLAIDSSSCQQASSKLVTTILPALPISLYQGMIKSASNNAGLELGTDDASFTIGHTFSRGILPLVNSARQASAVTIDKNMGYQNQTKPVIEGFSAVAQALRLAFPNLSTNCMDIGIFEGEVTEGSMCTGNAQPVAPSFPAPTLAPVSGPVAPVAPPTFAPISTEHPVATTPGDIGFRRYTFGSLAVAEGDASFALDVKAMFNAANVAEAKQVYESGLNANTLGLSGEFGVVSLMSFSTDAAEYMEHDPMFNIFKFALYDDEALEDTSGLDFLYADEVVQDALADGNDQKLAAEAAVAVNVWMVITHRLYSTTGVCSEGRAADDLIDSAVALWIGKEQAEGKYDHGWMLYSIGQSSAKYFGLPEGEAPVNTQLMTLFNEAQGLAKSCAFSDVGAQLRVKVDKIIQHLTKPLVQSLLFHMVKNNKNMVELYAVATVPQCAACDLRSSDALQAALFSEYDTGALTSDLIGHILTFLRCLRMTCGDLQVTDNADPALRDLVSTICNRLNVVGQLPMAGYVPATDVAQLARVDLDMLQLRIFMKTKAYKAALDIYRNGRNSFTTNSGEELRSLQSLATADDRRLVPTFQQFSDYYGSDTYADNLIQQAILQEDIMAGKSRGELQEVVTRTLQTMVCYMSVVSKLQLSINYCNQDQPGLAGVEWDSAVALFVGSIEGPKAGGTKYGNGEFLYAVGNEYCTYFDTCEGSDEAKANEQLMFQFASGRDALTSGYCDQVERSLTWDILPIIAIPLVQGTLQQAIFIDDLVVGDPDDDVATGFIMASAIGPLVKNENATSAATLSRNFDFTSSVPDGVPAVFEAFTYALRGMGVDCKDIGVTDIDFSVCLVQGVQVVAPHQDTGTNLGGNLYVTSTYVQDRANIALDVKAMVDALNEGRKDLARLIYEEGENSEMYDDNGQFLNLRTLRGFSIDSTLEMYDDPLFNIFQYALQDSDQNFLTGDARVYADTLVEDAFTLTSATSKTLPAEAAVVLNLWMYLAHSLYETLRSCQNMEIRNEDGVHSMDIAVAYWIGDGQTAGDGDSGHVLYALAEKLGESFNIDEGGQTRTNTNILKLFSAAKNEISLPNACSDSPGTFVRLHGIVNKIVSQMAIPLIQGLIQSLRLDDRDRVKLYAHAFVPLVAGCSPTTFAFLRDKLINLEYNAIEVDTIVQQIRSTYPCLSLQCDDIGVLSSEKLDPDDNNACKDPDVLNPLAGYTPLSDVRDVS